MKSRGVEFEDDDDVPPLPEGPCTYTKDIDAELRALSNDLSLPGEQERFSKLSQANELQLFHEQLGALVVEGRHTSAADALELGYDESGDVATKRVNYTAKQSKMMREFFTRVDKMPEISARELAKMESQGGSEEDFERELKKAEDLSPLVRKWRAFELTTGMPKHSSAHAHANALLDALFSGGSCADPCESPCIHARSPEDVHFLLPVIGEYVAAEGAAPSAGELAQLACECAGGELTPAQLSYYPSASSEERRFAGLLIECAGDADAGERALEMLPSGGGLDRKGAKDVGRVVVSTFRGLKKADKLDTLPLKSQKPWQYHLVNEQKFGDGPGQTRNMVVFIHGINAKEPVWTQQALALAAAVRNEFPYAFFPHIKQHKNGTLAEYSVPVVRAIIEYLDKFKDRVKKIMVVGISNGGRIALEVEYRLRPANVFGKDIFAPTAKLPSEKNPRYSHLERADFPDGLPQLFVVTVASPLAGTKSARAVPKFISKRIYGDAFLEEVDTTKKDAGWLVKRAIEANDHIKTVLFAHFYFDKDYMVWPPPNTWVNEQLAFGLGAEAHHLVQQNPIVIDLLGKFAKHFAVFPQDEDMQKLSTQIDETVPKRFERGKDRK